MNAKNKINKKIIKTIITMMFVAVFLIGEVFSPFAIMANAANNTQDVIKVVDENNGPIEGAVVTLTHRGNGPHPTVTGVSGVDGILRDATNSGIILDNGATDISIGNGLSNITFNNQVYPSLGYDTFWLPDFQNKKFFPSNTRHSYERIMLGKSDKTPPTLNLTQYPTEQTSGAVTITASASDSGSGVASITKPDNTVVAGSNTTYTVTTNGYYNFMATDNAGNTSSQVSYTVNNIIAPTTGLAISVNDSSNQSIPQYTNSGGIQNKNNIFSSPVRLAANAMAKISYNFTNVTMAKYQFVKASNLNPAPDFPQDSTMTNINLPAPNSQAAYGTDIGQQGYINTKHYVYEGKAGQELSRDVSFGAPIGNGVLVQQAIPATDIYETQGAGSNAFLLDVANNNVAYRSPSNKNAAVKAMKLWGYFCPQRTGSYLLGAYSDDGAYGYIIVNGVKQVFVNDWRIASPQFRATPAGTSSDTQVNTRNKYTGINLEGGKYYPIYMEWYEGKPNQAAFVPQYLYNSNSNYQFTIPNDINSGNRATNTINYAIPSNELYSSKTTTPGDIAEAYFGDVSGISFPNQDGIYYIATKFISGEGTTSGLYGPFIIDTTPPTLTLTQSTKDPTTGKVTITSEVKDSGSGVKLVTNPNGTVTKPDGTVTNSDGTVTKPDGTAVTDSITTYTVSADGPYKFTATDNAGNTTTKSINVDVTGPTLTLAVSPTNTTNGKVTITAETTDGGSGVASITNMTATDGKPQGTATKPINSVINANNGMVTNSDGTLISDSIITYTVGANGTYEFTAQDNAGNTITKSIPITNIDTTAPDKPVITSPTEGKVINNNKPPITGTGEVGATVTVYDNGTPIGTATVDSSGKWSLTPGTALADGKHTITATQADAAGNVSPRSDAVNITIDTTAPTLTLSASPTTATNGMVTINAETTDGGSGVASITNVTATNGKAEGTVTNPTNSVTNNGIVTNSDGTLISGSTITYTVSANGTYEFTATDNAGNTTTKSIDVNNINATVQGTVIDSKTKNPISGATVSVKSANGETISSGTTGSDGKYTLSNIAAPASGVQVTIEATANDYGTQDFTQTLVGKVDAYTQNFSLNPYNLPSISLSQSPDAATYTNGSVVIRATGSAGTNPVKDIILPNGTSVSGASAQCEVTSNGVYTFIVEDTEGKRAQATIKINNIYATVQGTVRDAATSNTLSGVTVTVKNTNGDTLASMTTGSDGKYTFNNIVAPAAGVQVTIEASADDYSTQSFSKTLVGRVNGYEQDFSLTSTFESSIIKAHGIYGGNGAVIADGSKATKDIPITMAMIVNAGSSHPVINWSVDDDSKITVDNNSFKGYEISADNTIGSATSLTIDGNGNITGIAMQKDKKYLIVYTITPSVTGTITLTATADGTSRFPIALNVVDRPDLF